MIKFKFVPINLVVPHEHTCEKHTQHVSKSILKCGYLKHPIQAIELDDKYMILDGHHRFNTLKSIEVKYIPLQIMEESSLSLKYWYHSSDALKTLVINEVEETNKKDYICSFNSFDKKIEIFGLNQEKLDLIWSFFHQYEKKGYVREFQPNRESWINYSGVTLDDIKEWVRMGKITPPGITRFLISHRILNLNVPLRDLYEKNQLEWTKIYEKISNGRLYEESIFHID